MPRLTRRFIPMPKGRGFLGEIGNLIFSAQANHLELITLKNLSLQDNMEKEHGKSFEMNLLGSWADTVAFINGFSAKDALIAIRKVRFTPESDGKIKTTLEYKVFIK